MDIWRVAKGKGLKVSKSQIWNILRNSIYCGKIYVPTYKKEEAIIVQGKHQPLISESLFNEVQDVLNGRKRKPLGRRYGQKENGLQK